MLFFFENIQNFLDKGGWVLYLIFLTVFILWILVIERLWYFYFDFKKDAQMVFNKWEDCSNFHSLSSKKIWKSDLSTLTQKLNKNISHVKTLVSLCPLLGLLGTVTGMIAVFEIMSAIGTGNARLMAGGISQATIPTMAGMTGALSGIYIGRILENYSKSRQKQLISWFANQSEKKLS